MRRLEAQTYTEVAKLETNTMLRSLNAFQQAIMLVDVAAARLGDPARQQRAAAEAGCAPGDACLCAAAWAPSEGPMLLQQLTNVLMTLCSSPIAGLDAVASSALARSDALKAAALSRLPWFSQAWRLRRRSASGRLWELFRAAPQSEEQVREGFMEFTSQLKPFSVWLELKERVPSPKFKINFK